MPTSQKKQKARNLEQNPQRQKGQEQQGSQNSQSPQSQEQREQKESPNNEKYQETARQITELFKSLSYYPHSLDKKEREKIKQRITEIYQKGDNKEKGIVLFYLNEKIGKIDQMRKFITLKSSIEELKGKNIDPHTYTMSNLMDYFSSIDGQFCLLELLAGLDDSLSAKFLTNYISKFLAMSGKTFSMLAEKSISLLGKINDLYAVEFLFELKGFVPEFSNSLNFALAQWAKKLNNIKMDKDEKAGLEKKLEPYLQMEHEQKHYA